LGARDQESVFGHCGRLRKGNLARQTLTRFVRAQRGVGGHRISDHVRGGRDVLEVELADFGDVVEHGRQLARHRLNLILVERQASEPGYMQDFIASDHKAGFYGAGG
jgi:hypothetical protein